MPESMLTNWLFGCTMVVLGVVLLMEIHQVSVTSRKHARENHLRGLMNRVAKSIVVLSAGQEDEFSKYQAVSERRLFSHS